MRLMVVMLLVLSPLYCRSNSILIPMDDAQRNHLKAYGIAFYVLQQDITLDWLLNYRGGSFLIEFSKEVQQECLVLLFRQASDVSQDQRLGRNAEIRAPRQLARFQERLKIHAVGQPLRRTP